MNPEQSLPTPSSDLPPSDAAAVDFASLGLDARLLGRLEAVGFTTPTPIQQAAIPVLLQGTDVVGQAATGTGKTAAFGLPMLNRMLRRDSRDNRPRGVVLVPTRELAMQVADALQRMGGNSARIAAVFGGAAMGNQIRVLRQGVDIVVGTPGRFLDLQKRGALRVDGVEILVLDEADEMLEMGFAEDLEAILGAMPSERQSALFSATFPKRIIDMAERHMVKPQRIRMQQSKTRTAGENVEQWAYGARRQDKPAALLRLLCVEEPTSCIVFCRTRRDVDDLLTRMRRRNHAADGLHGGMSQAERDRVMARFREGTVATLIATDVAARGLDIDHVSHVVNYDLPENPEVYTHRVGRTGRAGRHGVAISLVQPAERRALGMIERKLRQTIAVRPLPTLADLQHKRLAKAVANIEACLAAPLKSVAVLQAAQALGDKFSGAELAHAALQQALAGFGAGEDEREIDSCALQEPARAGRERPAGRPTHRESREGSPSAARNRARSSQGGWAVAQLYVGAGRLAGVRPADLVGAIANELDLDSRAIGAIEIAPHFSLVEVPAEIIDDIVDGMRRTTIKGKRVTVRRDREQR